MIKNCHALLLIDKILDCMSESKFFTKLDVYNAYHHIYIKLDNK